MVLLLSTIDAGSGRSSGGVGFVMRTCGKRRDVPDLLLRSKCPRARIAHLPTCALAQAQGR